VRLRSNQDAVATGIAYVSEDRLSLGLNLRQSIADNHLDHRARQLTSDRAA
jgi:simple sugar transport system ATP-binding protein